MGQKVNPVGFRLLNNKNWESVWYDKKNYATNLFHDIKIRQFIKTNYSLPIATNGHKCCRF